MAISNLLSGNNQAAMANSQFERMVPVSIQKAGPPPDVPFQTLNLKESEFIFRQGDQLQGFYFLKSGAVKTGMKPKVTRGRANTNVYVSRLIGAGEFFGYKAIFSGETHQFFAKTIRPSQVLVYPKQVFDALIHGPNTLMKLVLEQSIKDLEKTEEQTQLHYLASVEERIAQQLLTMADKFGLQTPEGIKISLKLTRNEVAQLAGTINESLSRHLTSLKKEGIIDIHGRELIVKDRPALAKIAGYL